MATTLRRNGCPASCESCRRAKVRCDHALPECGRCVRRAQQCYYHPAPLSAGGNAKKRPRIDETPRPRVTQPPLSYSPSQNTSPSMDATPDSPGRSTSFVGMHTALHNLAIPPDTQTPRPFTLLTKHGVANSVASYTPTAADTATALYVLDALRAIPEDWHPKVAQAVSDDAGRGLYTACFFFSPIMDRAISVAAALHADVSEESARSIASAIFDNTCEELEFPAELSKERMEHALPKPRWEMIGIYFSAMAEWYILKHNPTVMGMNGSSWNTALLNQFLTVITECDKICTSMGNANDLSIWQTWGAYIVSTWCYGDNSYASARFMGIIGSTINAMNYHTGFKNKDFPDYLIQIRRVLLARIYINDVHLSTFTGRPVYMPRQYYVKELPLDRPLQDFYEHYKQSSADKDSNEAAWSPWRDITHTTLLRAKIQLCAHREEALELMLGTGVSDVPSCSAALARLDSTWQSLRQYHVDWHKITHVDTKQLSMQKSARLEYLYTQYLLLKMLVCSDPANRAKLMETSHEILSLVLLNMRSKRILAGGVFGLEWMVIFYALPATLTLLLQLYREHQQSQALPGFDRALVIKDISALIWCCDLVAETGIANYALCKQAQTLFSRGLDIILNEQPAASKDAPISTQAVNRPQDVGDEGQDGALEEDAALDDSAWTTWLQSVGLEHDTWLDLANLPPMNWNSELV